MKYFHRWKGGICTLLVLWSTYDSSMAEAPKLSLTELGKVPPRVIRTCCSFGSDLKMLGLPMVRVTQSTSMQVLGPHQYLGHPSENNGIIYTRRGGFIDLGHLRDQADWTAYLYLKISHMMEIGEDSLHLGFEGAQKNLLLQMPAVCTTEEILNVAGRIAYDLSVWHELATWFGASLVPLFPERYSSFSIEDAYSNLLGVKIGIMALKSDLPFEEAMTRLIRQTLNELEPVETEEETLAAMEAVRDIWWTRDKNLPGRKVLLEREVEVYPALVPWLIPGAAQEPMILELPGYLDGEDHCGRWYDLRFRLGSKFPSRKIFPGNEERMITQRDFPELLEYVEWELYKDKTHSTLYRKNQRENTARWNGRTRR